MTRPERHNNRDLRYSHWHREVLPGWCYTTDLDWIEWREERGIVAFIETKLGLETPLSEFQRKVFPEIERRSGIPFYAVNFDERLRFFRLQDMTGHARVLTEQQYIEFLEGLGNGISNAVLEAPSVKMEEFI